MLLTMPLRTEWGKLLPAPSLAVAQLSRQWELLERPLLWEPVLLERVLCRIKIGGPFCCWEWQGYCHSKNHYGQVHDEITKGKAQVHRYVYQRLIGPIPDRLTLEHLCRNRCCCWPGHLLPMTGEDNTREMHEARYHIRSGQAPLDWDWRQR